MGRLIVHREPATWIDRARSYKIEVDGQAVGKIGNGETVDLKLSPGRHRVRMKVDWCGSREVMVDGSADARLHCAPGTNPFLAIFYVLFWRNDYITLRKV